MFGAHGAPIRLDTPESRWILGNLLQSPHGTYELTVVRHIVDAAQR